MFQRFFVLTTVLFVAMLLALRADDRGDRFVGTWKTKVKFGGHDQSVTIANDSGQWSVKGTYEKGGAVVGTFVGENVRFDGGQLMYHSRFVKKPVESWQDNDITLRLDGDALAMSFVAKTGEKIARAFERMPGDPKVAAKPPANEPAKPKAQTRLEEKLVGTWKGESGVRFDEYWTITYDGTSFKVAGTYWKNGKEVGSCHGTNVVAGKDSLTFQRTFDKKPAADLGTTTTCTFKVTESGVQLVVGSGAKAKTETLERGGEPKVAANDAGKPSNPKPAAPPRRTDGNFVGVWVGSFPNMGHRLTLNIVKQTDEWLVEAFVTSADNKRVAYFKQPDAKMDADGKSLTVTPAWVEKAPPITGDPALTLTPQPPALRAEFSDARIADKVTIDLARGDPRQYAQLKPQRDFKGRPTKPSGGTTDPGSKTSVFETFKLPPDIPPAKPFAVLDAKQHVVAMAVSPDGKRVALGSQQTLNGGFTADLSVWDIETQKQVWIKKKMIEEPVVGMVTLLAFSGDGKILTARPQKVGDYPLLFFDAATGQELRSPAPLNMKVDCLAFHPSKLLLAIGTSRFGSSGLELIDLRTGKSMWTAALVHQTAVDGLAFSPNGETIATFGRTADAKAYCVKLSDSTKGALIHDFGATQKGIANAVIFSGDGKLLAAHFGDLGSPGIVIWDTASKEEVRRITDLAPGTFTKVPNLAFLADNKTLAVSCWDRHLHLFDVTGGKQVGIYPRVFGIDVSAVFAVGDGQVLLTNKQSEGIIQLWRQSEALPPPIR
jgi:hypothetical protein